MKTIQTPMTAEHKSAMFFDGVIATKAGLELRTFQSGEIDFMGQHLVGQDIIKLGQTGIIDDEVIENERTVDILVDKFFAIYKEGSDEIWDADLIFDNYDDAIEAFMQI